MAGKAVAEHVRVQVLAQFAHAGLAHAQLDGARPQAAALLADKQRVIQRVGQGAQRQPEFQRRAGFAANWHYTHLVALAAYVHQAIGEVQLVGVQVHQFGQAQAAGIAEFQQGLVAVAEEVVLDVAVQQLFGAVGIQGFRQASFTFRWRQAIGRVVAAQALAVEVLVEAAYRRE